MSASVSARLGDFVEILSGFAFDAANFSDEGDIALIRIRDVLRGRSNTFYGGEYDEKYLINEGEILIGMDGEFNRARWQSAPALLNQRVCKIHSNSPRLADEYLFHFLPAALKSIEDATSFVTVKHLSAKQIREIEIPLPPVEEQRRIAAILDQAETLRTQRRQALAHLDTLTQSLFLDMFGDPMDLPKRWTFQPMAVLFETSPIFGTMIPGDAEGGPWLCLRVANIQDWQLTLEDRKYVDLPESAVDRHSVRAGDLLMARAIASQDHLGKCIVAQPGTEQWAFDSHLMRLRFRADRALPDFIRQMLRSPGGRKLFLKASRKSSVQYNINTKEISALEIPVPPIALQQTFATRIQAIEALKATHRTALAQLDALFASLQQRAFAGEL